MLAGQAQQAQRGSWSLHEPVSAGHAQHDLHTALSHERPGVGAGELPVPFQVQPRLTPPRLWLPGRCHVILSHS